MLTMFQKVYLGEVTNAKNEKLPDLQPREWASVLPLCALAILMGVLPSIFLAPMEPSVKKVVERVQAVRPVVAQATVPLGPAAVPATAVAATVQGRR
jgi:NADH-quinone oxidoreductase subunit M